jgi:hypothetical protein
MGLMGSTEDEHKLAYFRPRALSHLSRWTIGTPRFVVIPKRSSKSAHQNRVIREFREADPVPEK